MALPPGFVIDSAGAGQAPSGFLVDDAPAESKGIAQGALDSVLEVMSGVNRGVISLADIPADIGNAISQLAGSDFRVPKIGETEIGRSATAGGFVDDPIAKQVLGTVGEFASPAPPIAALSKSRGALSGVDDAVSAFTKQSATKQKIAKEIVDNPNSKKVAKFLRDGSGKVSKDPVAIEAIKQGFDEGVIAVTKASTPSDKAKLKTMLEVAKKGLDDSLFAAKNRPADVAGKSLIERISHIKKVNREAGSAVEKAAQSLKGKPVDFSPAVDDLNSALHEMGVTLTQTQSGKIRPNFKGSIIEGVSGSESAIKKLVARLSNTKSPDAFDVHRMKKWIDETVTFGKTKQGLAGKTERVLKQLRSGLDDVLDSNFPDYNDANTAFSETRGALDAFQDAAGSKVDLFGKNAEKAIGTTLRRLLGNTQSRANMIGSIDEIEEVARRTGANFSDDITTQMLFADELDSIFGPTARTSLAGETQKGVQAALDQRGLTARAVDFAADQAEKLRGINEENAIKSMEKLLSRGN